MARVFADTNVLFPFSLMDLLLTLAEDYVHDLVWSDRLLDEWQRVIVREGHRSTEAAERIAEHVRTGFADSCVPEDRYKHLLAELDGPDTDDVHHMAAAIAGHAETLITWNLNDFPA
jgi:predicted nucleic acid-binding protein